MVDWGHREITACEIWCFADLSALPDGVSIKIGDVHVGKGVYAVVESSISADENNTPQEHTKSSLFDTIFKDMDIINANTWTRKFYLADTEAFLEPICVVPDIGSRHPNKYFQLKRRNLWSKSFTSWLDERHKDDEISESDDESSDSDDDQ